MDLALLYVALFLYGPMQPTKSTKTSNKWQLISPFPGFNENAKIGKTRGKLVL